MFSPAHLSSNINNKEGCCKNKEAWLSDSHKRLLEFTVLGPFSFHCNDPDTVITVFY